MFKGSNVALITPFKNDKLDDETYIKLIHFHIENGTNGLVPAGTTGESPTLSHDEHERVIDLCVKESNGKLPVFAGTGSNSTEEAISLTTHAEKMGADGALIVTPYYNKPTQEGLYQHYKAINDKCGIPILIYNIPGRSVIDMSVETMARLFELKNIIGVKDATGDLTRVDKTLKKLGKDFIQLTGNDDNALEFNKKGGVGAISVTANIAPKLCSDFQRFSKSNNDNEIKEAERLNEILQPVHHAMFVESNPSPVKYAAKLLDLCDDDVRLPLVKVTDSNKEIKWLNSTDSWTFNKNIDLSDTTKSIKIGGQTKLTNTSLSNILYADELTRVGTLTALQVDSIGIDGNTISNGVSAININATGGINSTPGGAVTFTGAPQIKGVGDPTDVQDVATKSYTDTEIANEVIVMGFDITGLGTGSTLQAAVAGYLNDLYPAATINTCLLYTSDAADE